jgi:hypothetical protein
MKNIIIRTTILLFLLLFFSCAAKFPAPDSEEDTLLIVLTEKNIEGELDEVLSYFEIITDKSKKSIYITPNKPICITTNLPPGEYSNLMIVEKDYNSDFFERNEEIEEELKNIEVPFVLKPGYITFFPIKFIYNVQAVEQSVQKEDEEDEPDKDEPDDDSQKEDEEEPEDEEEQEPEKVFNLRYHWDVELVTEEDKKEALSLLKDEEFYSEWQNDLDF